MKYGYTIKAFAAERRKPPSLKKRRWAVAKLKNELIKSLTFYADVITMWILIKSRR